MPVLTPGKPIRTRRPELLVENKLEAGKHRFELVVIDDSGLESAPTELVVTVRAPRPIGPVIRPGVLNPGVLKAELTNRIVTPLNPRIIRPIR